MSEPRPAAAWLVVTLRAPLASFGERAGNAERSSAERPTRSALLGLAGAALGLRRDDREGQDALRRSFRVASRTVLPGALLNDFHTFQSLPSASRPRPATRAEALSRRGDLATSITRREYRSDVWFEAAFAANEGSRWSLKELQAAFRLPRFILFLGRKSCPLACPLEPFIDEAGDGLLAVFERRLGKNIDYETEKDFRARWRRRVPQSVAAEREDDLGPPANIRPRLRRRVDEPGDRMGWQFFFRDEFVVPLPPIGGAP